MGWEGWGGENQRWGWEDKLRESGGPTCEIGSPAYFPLLAAEVDVCEIEDGRAAGGLS